MQLAADIILTIISLGFLMVIIAIPIILIVLLIKILKRK